MYKLGKLPARKGAVQFAMSKYFDMASLPKPPKNFGRYWRIEKDGWGFLGNDKCSNCVQAGAAHETMYWGIEPWRTELQKAWLFDESSVIAAYSDMTGYDPDHEDSDQGTDMTEAASYRRKHGIYDTSGRLHKIDAYVALHARNFDQLRVAMYLFGAVGVGIMLPETAMTQFEADKPWAVVPDRDEVLGGHYVTACGIKPNGNIAVITFGRCIEMTPQFYQVFNDETIAYLSMERIRNKVSVDGFHADKLAADLKTLGG